MYPLGTKVGDAGCSFVSGSDSNSSETHCTAFEMGLSSVIGMTYEVVAGE